MSLSIFRGGESSFLLPLHLPQEEEDSGDEGCGAVADHPPQMGENAREVTGKHGLLQLHGVHEGQRVGDALEHAADQGEVKPYPRQPGREVGQQCAADAAHLLVGQHAAAQQAERDIEQCDGQDEQKGIQDAGRQFQTEQDGRKIAHPALSKRNGQDGQGVAEDKIGRRHRRGVEPLEQGAAPVLGDDSCRKQGHKRY